MHNMKTLLSLCLFLISPTTHEPTKKLKNQKNKQQTWNCSRLFVSLSLRSKILSLDNSKSKTSFYLELFSLIRIFVGSMILNNVYSRKK